MSRQKDIFRICHTNAYISRYNINKLKRKITTYYCLKRVKYWIILCANDKSGNKQYVIFHRVFKYNDRMKKSEIDKPATVFDDMYYVAFEN